MDYSKPPIHISSKEEQIAAARSAYDRLIAYSEKAQTITSKKKESKKSVFSRENSKPIGG